MTRYGRLLDDILRKHRHASEQEILGFLDGELTPRQTDWVRRHLEACWSCRAASEKTAETVAGFIEYRQHSLSLKAGTWPSGWPSLEARLRELPAPPARPFRRGFLAVPVLALMAAGFLFFRLTSTPPVSAAAVLENARRAEQSPPARNGLLTYKKLEVRRRVGFEPLKKAVYEVWADGRTSRVRHSGAEPLLAEIEAVFAANSRRQPPLSATGFESWRNSIPKKREQVLPGMNAGAEVLTVKTEVEGPLRADAIREGRIVIRTDTWTPVAESISVGEKERERLYEFEAVESRLVDRGSMPYDDPAPAASAVRMPAANPPLPVERTGNPPANPDGGLLDEIAAHYALHRLGACLDGTVELVPRPGEVLVRGVVESEQRKAELERALADIPAVKVQLQFADAARMVGDALSIEAGDVITIESRRSPLSQRLREYLQANPGAGTPSERAAKLANQAVSHARELRRNAWAVRRLSERFTDVEQLARSAPARWLLEMMIQDHASALGAETGALKDLLDPLLLYIASPLQPGDGAENAQPAFDSWRRASAEVFGGQREVENLIHELLTGSGEAASAGTAASRLRVLLTALQRQTRLLSEQASKNLANLHPKEVIP